MMSCFDLGVRGSAMKLAQGLFASSSGILFSGPKYISSFRVQLVSWFSSCSFILLHNASCLAHFEQLVKYRSHYFLSFANNIGDVSIFILIIDDRVGKYCVSLDPFCSNKGFSLSIVWGRDLVFHDPGVLQQRNLVPSPMEPSWNDIGKVLIRSEEIS
jgi:hypothetical protein